MEQETINDRIEMLINEHYNGNKAAFAKSIGYPPTGLSSYLSRQRRSKPPVDMLAKIVKVLDVDAKWLLMGEQSTTNSATVNGDGSVAVNGNNNNNVVAGGSEALLQERIKHLEELVAEKERLINVLMNK